MLVVMLQIYNKSLVLMHISGLKDAFKVFLFPETHVYQAENKTIKVRRRKWTTMYTVIILLLSPDPQGPAYIIPLTKHGNENWCEQSGMSRPEPVQKKTIQPCTCMSLLKKLIMEYNVKKTIQLYFWCNACFLHKFLAYNWGISF